MLQADPVGFVGDVVQQLEAENAQDKAEYMLEALDEKCGKVLMINESEYGYQPPVMYRSNVAMEKSGNAGNSATELKNITISYKVNATFAIEG